VNEDATSFEADEATVIAFCADAGDLVHASTALVDGRARVGRGGRARRGHRVRASQGFAPIIASRDLAAVANVRTCIVSGRDHDRDPICDRLIDRVVEYLAVPSAERHGDDLDLARAWVVSHHPLERCDDVRDEAASQTSDTETAVGGGRARAVRAREGGSGRDPIETVSGSATAKAEGDSAVRTRERAAWLTRSQRS
jgi:hypothetical protein